MPPMLPWYHGTLNQLAMFVGNLLDVPRNLLNVPPNHCSVLCDYSTIAYLHHCRFII
jgi:hypothetical protein